MRKLGMFPLLGVVVTLGLGQAVLAKDRKEDRKDEKTEKKEDRKTEKVQRKEVSFDTLPGAVKTVIAQERKSGQIDEVLEIRKHGETYYRAIIESSGRDRVVVVKSDGTLVTSKDLTPEGKKLVQFDSLPGAVKTAIAKEAGGKKVLRVVQVTRDHKTVYRARIEGEGTITVDDSGKVLDDDDDRPEPKK